MHAHSNQWLRALPKKSSIQNSSTLHFDVALVNACRVDPPRGCSSCLIVEAVRLESWKFPLSTYKHVWERWDLDIQTACQSACPRFVCSIFQSSPRGIPDCSDVGYTNVLVQCRNFCPVRLCDPVWSTDFWFRCIRSTRFHPGRSESSSRDYLTKLAQTGTVD